MLRNIKEGDRYGRLTVIKQVQNKGNCRAFLCRCDCGNETIVRATHLNCHAIRSCGCLRKSNGKPKYAISSRHPIYRLWTNMKTRCYNKNNHSYETYGRRGITVCEEWLNDFQTFATWAILNGWKEGLQIDRIDNDKGYSPENCHFITLEENLKKRRTKTKRNSKREIQT